MNNMLLSGEKGGIKIPYKPFTDEEVVEYFLSDGFITANFNGTQLDETNEENFVDLTGWARQMPYNHCTIIFGITDKDCSEIAQTSKNMNVRGILRVGPRDYAEDGSMSFSPIISMDHEIVSGNVWEETTNEIYVQLDFEDKNDLNFYPSFLLGSVIGNIEIDGINVCAYPNIYIKKSNQIHERGPDIKISIAKKPATL